MSFTFFSILGKWFVCVFMFASDIGCGGHLNEGINEMIDAGVWLHDLHEPV